MYLGISAASGSRRTGHESSLRYESGQRIYRISEDGSRVSLNQLETQTQDPHHLYNDKGENNSEEIVTFNKQVASITEFYGQTADATLLHLGLMTGTSKPQ